MTRLEQMIASGELHRLAQGCASVAELARKAAVNSNTLKSNLRGRGLTLEKLQGGNVREVTAEEYARIEARLRTSHEHAADCVCNESVEPPAADCYTPPVAADVAPDRWPNVAAFDEVEVPLPVLAPGFHVKGVSSLVDVDGNVKAQWVKTGADASAVDPVEVLRLAFGEAGVLRVEPVEPPSISNDDLLATVVFGDPHFGQLSWHRDAGENFDLAIAERNMVAAVEHLVALAPGASQCLLVWIGDNTHSDGQSNTTTKGTRVDVDGRTTKMLAVTIRAFKSAINMALAKFGRVHCIVERGNHDELLSTVIALALEQAYENNDRVTIDNSPESYHFYRFGQNLIGTHHGDKAKPIDLLGVMANDRAKDWGETKHRRFYCGHIHHEVVKEVPGLTVEYMRTLAPADAWHRAQGYRAGRDLRLDVFHREYGMINRFIVGIQQLVEGLAA